MSDLVVSIRRGADADAFRRALDSAGVRWERLVSIDRTYIVEGFTVDDFPLRGHPDVIAVDDGNAPTTPFSGPQQIRFDSENSIARWALIRHTVRDLPWPSRNARMPMEHVFECARDGSGVDVYMVDSGVRPTHAEWGGRSVTSVYKAAAGEVDDVTGHGTLCLSAAVGETLGFARKANLFSAQYWVGGTIPNGSSSNAARALDATLTHWKGRAALDTPGVVNLSWGGVGQAMAAACVQAAEAGLVFCAAAGNDASDLRQIAVGPTLTDRVLTVGGCAMHDGPYYRGVNDGSNFGDQIDCLVASQDTYIAGHTADDEYRFASGTSPGCGYVTGIVACMLQGYRRPTSEAQVMAIQRYVRDQATYGRYRRARTQPTMRDGIIYLDTRPAAACPPIPGLVKKT